MNDTAEPPVKASAEADSPKKMLLEAVDLLNLVMEMTDQWMYQARAISILAEEQASNRDYRLFPQTISAMAEMLRHSINSSTINHDASCLIIDLTMAAERSAGVPAHS